VNIIAIEPAERVIQPPPERRLARARARGDHRACEVQDTGGRRQVAGVKFRRRTAPARCERSLAMLKGLLWVVVIIFVIGLLVVLGVLDFIF